MPPIDVFGGIQELLASSSTPITCLPSREELAEWVAEHDKIEQEAEQFDAGDMNRLKKFTKGEFIRCLFRCSPLISSSCDTTQPLSRGHRFNRSNSHHPACSRPAIALASWPSRELGTHVYSAHMGGTAATCLE